MVPGVFWTRVSGLRDIRGNRTSAGGLTPAALGVVPTGLAWVANLPRAYALGYPLPPLRGSLTSALRGTDVGAARLHYAGARALVGTNAFSSGREGTRMSTHHNWRVTTVLSLPQAFR